MKAFFAEVVRLTVIAFLETGEQKEFGSYPPDTDYKDIKWEWDEIEAKYGKLTGIGTRRIYNTPSGKLEPGCLFWADWYPKNFYWDNQDGPHLIAVLPNGHHWDIDSRASNCDMPGDKLHRCWCRHGEPPNVTVDKNGLTCHAGAGSIAVEGYHGFLTNGEFIP